MVLMLVLVLVRAGCLFIYLSIDWLCIAIFVAISSLISVRVIIFSLGSFFSTLQWSSLYRDDW
jgi:hypothetical protein